MKNIFNIVRTKIDMNAPKFKNIHSISKTDDTQDIYAEIKCNLIDLDKIQKAVNFHNELVETLEYTKKFFEKNDIQGSESIYTFIQDALKNVKSEDQ